MHMKVKFEGGIKDVPLKEVTAANYIVPQGEERSWHVIQEKKEYDRNTGKQLSRPVLQKYDTKCYPQTRKYLMDAGYTITVLHDPIQWAQQHQQAQLKAQAQRNAGMLAAERAKMKAEIMAEIKAEFDIKPKKATKKK